MPENDLSMDVEAILDELEELGHLTNGGRDLHPLAHRLEEAVQKLTDERDFFRAEVERLAKPDPPF